MDRSFSIPKSIKRCRSLSQIDNLRFDDGKNRKRNGSGKKSNKLLSAKFYRGRLSLGKPAGSSGRIHRRKSRACYLDDDDEEYYSKYDDVPTISTFRCLPVIERDSSSTSLTESRKTSKTNLVEATLSSDERAQLFLNLESFLNADRSAKSSKLVVNQKTGGEKYEQTFTIGSKKEKHKYGDVLWLILKAYFSGREVSGGQDATFEMDSIVCKKREARFEILDTIVQYKAELPLKDSYDIDEPYVRSLTSTRSHVCEILDEFERYQSLFPHSRAMEDVCSSQKDVRFKQLVVDRVAILTSWLNTVDDLAAKIDMLGEVFEVARLPNAEKIWPRPLHYSRQKVCLTDARPVFKEYVGRSLNLKGMKKVLARVWELCETSVIKAAILLQRPPSSYAQAASRKILQLSSEIVTRYGEMIKFSMNSDKAIAMRLPSIVPIFIFVLGVRMELVMEWLSIRSNSTLPIGCEMDVLTLDTMVEDSRDCIEEAVRVKLYHLNVTQSICPGRVKLCSAEFNYNLKDVFQKYLWYVSCWCRAIASGAELGGLFSRLEVEWAAAIKCARSIQSGLDHITTTFSSLVPHLLENLVVEFWEKSTESITEKHSMQDIRISSSDEEEDINSRDHTSVFAACREYNRVIREVKDRSTRIFTLLRGALQDLHDAVGYEIKESIDIVALRLTDHCLVEIGDDVGVPVSILVDTASADRAMVGELITALLEGRRPNNGHILLIPDNSFRNHWIYRRVKLAIDEENFHNLRYLRNDVAFVIGNNFDLNNKLPGLFELTMPSCSSHDIVDGQLKDLAKNLVSHSRRVWQLIEHMFTAFELACDSRRMCDSINSTFLQALNFAFQLHRDVNRVVSDSYRLQFGGELSTRCVAIIQRWRDLVIRMKPSPSPNIPLWASHAFNFIHYLTDPKWTTLLEDELFKEFESCIKHCKQLVVSTDGSNSEEATMRCQSCRSTASLKKRAHVIHDSRRAQLEAAASKTDKDVARRQAYPLGKVIMKRREEFTLENYGNPKKGVPFKWQIMEQLGSGSFSVVHKALNVDKQCVIAVKKVRGDRGVLKVLEGEVDILRNLNHRNLVKYYGCEVLQDEVLILMEYCSEGTLERICREGLDTSLVRRYTNNLMHAVSYIHNNKVVHRDIKPENIFLDLHCVLKLGDFGCSVRLRDTTTVFGEILQYVGTPQYMAPEIQTFGEKLEDGGYRGYGRAVDIWSIGCVVLEMATGRRPWPDMHPYQITMKVCQGGRPAYPAHAPAILCRFLDACFEYNPDLRKSADQLLQDPFVNIHVDCESVCTSFDLLPEISGFS